jgi:glycosyltransferase involved in cell wall biosynthesis
MSPLRLSVVLPTYNRAESLRRALAALTRQCADPASYEVVVVDNNCTDGTGEMVRALEDPRIRLVGEARQGLSFARNAGLAATEAPIVVFTDDDVEVARDWVETIVTSLDRNPSVDGVGGRVLPAWECGRPPEWLTREHWAPLALQDHGDARAIFDRNHPVGLIGANVAFRRAVFDRVGLFSPTVQRVRNGIGSTEDHELLTRLYDAGGRMLYQPRMLVLARVQADRCDPAYHRRWHEGHGRFYALMRLADVERTRLSPLGIPGHLVRSAARDAVEWLRSVFTGDWNHAFLAELRLRFFKGFVWTRLAR